MIAPPTPAKAKTTFQSLSKIPGVTGLYRHDNGSYYGKKKVRGVKKVAPLKTTRGENIFDRKIAEAALKSWSVTLETPSLSDGKKTLGEWFSKLKELWTGKAKATVDKVDYASRCIELDLQAQARRGVNLLEMPLDAIKPSDLSAFLARLSKRLGAHAFNGVSRIFKNVFEAAVNDGAILINAYARVPKTIRRKKIILAPAQVPSIDQCQAICNNVRKQKHSPKPEPTADMLEFMHLAALGQAECILSDWSKVNWQGEFIEVKRQKTGTYFRVPIYEHLRPFLSDMWKRQGEPNSGPMFSILSPKQALYNACRRLGLESYSPIDFRKARIVWMVRKGVPVETLARWQGHKDNGVLIRKTYAWVISEADDAYEKEQLAKLAAPLKPKKLAGRSKLVTT
jgi:integrase